MQFTITLLSFASLGLNILPAQSAAVSSADLAHRAEESINNVYRSNMNLKRHDYTPGEDELAKREYNLKRHDYTVNGDEIA